MAPCVSAYSSWSWALRVSRLVRHLYPVATYTSTWASHIIDSASSSPSLSLLGLSQTSSGTTRTAIIFWTAPGAHLCPTPLYQTFSALHTTTAHYTSLSTPCLQPPMIAGHLLPRKILLHDLTSCAYQTLSSFLCLFLLLLQHKLTQTSTPIQWQMLPSIPRRASWASLFLLLHVSDRLWFRRYRRGRWGQSSRTTIFELSLYHPSHSREFLQLKWRGSDLSGLHQIPNRWTKLIVGPTHSSSDFFTTWYRILLNRFQLNWNHPTSPFVRQWSLFSLSSHCSVASISSLPAAQPSSLAPSLPTYSDSSVEFFTRSKWSSEPHSSTQLSSARSKQSQL